MIMACRGDRWVSLSTRVTLIHPWPCCNCKTNTPLASQSGPFFIIIVIPTLVREGLGYEYRTLLELGGHDGVV